MTSMPVLADRVSVLVRRPAMAGVNVTARVQVPCPASDALQPLAAISAGLRFVHARVPVGTSPVFVMVKVFASVVVPISTVPKSWLPDGAIVRSPVAPCRSRHRPRPRRCTVATLPA
jgi:hypothetical protein